MIDPIRPAAFAPATPGLREAVCAVPDAGASSGPRTGDGENAPALPAPKPDAVSLSVDRDDAGVFVYTLTDSASGRVLAVIPRSAVAPSAQTGEEVDIQA